ncbi:MAG: DUF2235 domain-containing protein, partial [Pseudomonadota bacterium]
MAKNIFIFSDGTGNSSKALFKSNVWRLYQALDLGPAQGGAMEQIALYDDGVGTSGVTVLQKLGGAFGFGLNRNVRQLYEKLCRVYEPGDEIYIFGFSRGGFTARMLAGLIGACGIIDPNKTDASGKPLFAPNYDDKHVLSTERGLTVAVEEAHKAFRTQYWKKPAQPDIEAKSKLLAVVQRRLHNLLGKILRFTPRTFEDYSADDFKKRYAYDSGGSSSGDGDTPSIRLVGVWDTVDALGLPIEELADAL